MLPKQEPAYCAHTLCFAEIWQTQWRRRQLVEVLVICRWPATDTIHSVFPLFVGFPHVNLQVALVGLRRNYCFFKLYACVVFVTFVVNQFVRLPHVMQ